MTPSRSRSATWLGTSTVREDPGVQCGVQGLHPAAEDRGESGELLDGQVLDARVAKASAVPPDATSSTPSVAQARGELRRVPRLS
jgi:hypothetical protein